MVRAALSHLTVSCEDALGLFAVFSRFEFALKVNASYRRPGNGEAKADWIAFANAVSLKFNPQRTAEVAEAFAYITGQPLRHLVVGNHGLAWAPFHLPPVASDAERVIRLIRQVRNNLFHGGKFAQDPQAEEDRDPQLLRMSLVLLEELLWLEPGVKAAYSD